jgi:hypothetical protein
VLLSSAEMTAPESSCQSRGFPAEPQETLESTFDGEIAARDRPAVYCEDCDRSTRHRDANRVHTARVSARLGSGHRANFDLPLALARFQTRLVVRGRAVQYATIGERELRPMPGTDDRTVFQRALGQWAAEMGA